jgi:hypothetical protein
MWYPTKNQWSVIWVTTVIFLIAWLRSDPSPDAFVMPAMLVCALFFWHVSAALWGGTHD